MAETNTTSSPKPVQVPGATWQPVPHTVFRDEKLAGHIHQEGYAVVDFLDEAQLEALRAIHAREHKLEVSEGGMFYSLYSQDYEYRRRIHEEVRSIMLPSFEKYFKDYENVINLFIVKVSGPASEFAIHQDTTAVDEKKISPLSVWTPLWDINPDSGAMCMVPKSHWFFSPYRGISFPFPFSKIYPEIRQYLQPVYMKAGQALFFDPRILHNSLPNTSGKDRVSIVSGIFPPKADIVTCFKEPGLPDAKIELLQHDDNFLLEYPNFLQNCHMRPPTGLPVGFADIDMEQIDAEWFQNVCALNGVEPVNEIPAHTGLDCNMIGEPDGTVPVAEECPVEPVAEAAAPGGFLGKIRNAFSKK